MSNFSFVSMKEYQSLEEIRLSDDSVDILKTYFPHALTIHANRKSGHWNISSHSFVGKIVLPDLTIQIEPKIDIPTFWNWISIAFDLSSLKWNKNNITYSNESSFQEWLVKFFISECEKIYTIGLRKGYISYQDQLQTVRGQLQTKSTINMWIRNDYRFDCKFDELTHWVKENQIVYAGLVRMNQFNYHDPTVYKKLKRLIDLYGLEKPHNQNITMNSSYWLNELSKLPISRLNEQYKEAFQLLNVFWKGISLSMEFGDVSANSFLLDMNELFELYIAKRLEHELLAYDIKVYKQKHDWLADEAKIKIIPDIILQNNLGQEIIIDTKYKQRYDDRSINSNIFQMLAYLVARKTTTGILLYAAGPQRFDRIKNTDKNIYQWSLHLEVRDSDFEEKFSFLKTQILNLFG